MAPIKGIRPRVHQPLRPYLTGEVHRRNNPLVEVRSKPGKTGIVEDVTDVPFLQVVRKYMGRGHEMSPAGLYIEVREMAYSKEEYYERGPRGVDGEIVVYMVDWNTDLGTQLSQLWLPEDMSADMALRDDPEKNAEFTKENATVIIRHETHGKNLDVGEYSDYPELETREHVGVDGWRDVLADLIDGPTHLPYSTPVKIFDQSNPDGLMLTLNTSMLTVRGLRVFTEIYEACMGRKEYNETNEDSVSDLPTAIPGESKNVIARNIAQGDMYRVSAYGHGWETSSKTEARRKLLALVEACELSTTNPTRKLDDLARFIREAVKYSDIWCLSDPNDERRPDPQKDYVFMTYETEDSVEEQLDVPEWVKLRNGDTEDDTEEGANVERALNHVDIRPQDNDIFMIDDVNAHWHFSIDIDTLIEEMCGEWQDLPDSF